MAETEAEILAARKERIRLRKKEYNAQPHLKEYRCQASIARSHANKLMTTKKRLMEHSIDELLFVAGQRCAELGIDYAANEPAIRAVLAIYHGPDA